MRALFILTSLMLALMWSTALIEVPIALAGHAEVTATPQSAPATPTPQPSEARQYALRSSPSLAPLASSLSNLVSRMANSGTTAPANTTNDLDAPSAPQEEVDGVPLVEVPDGVINVVLLGTDKRPQWGDWRTDTIIVVSINPQAESVGMLSIPRDLWVRMPGFGVGRINTVDFIGEWKGAEGGGPGLLKRTIEVNLGLPIHRYARIDLEGFVQVIDALGGVTIDIECPVRDAFLDEPLTGEEGLAMIDLDVGVHHLDGLTALRYARSRRHGTDFDRARRQQKLLRSLAEQHLNWQLIMKLPYLWQSLKDAVETDLTLAEIVQLAMIGVQVQQDHIKSRFIDWRTTENWVTAGGAQVLLPNRETLPQAVAEFLNPPEEDRYLKAEHARIEVQNGTTTEGLAEIAARRLMRAGLRVVGTTQTGRLQRSTIIVYSPKPRTLKALQDTLNLDPEAVVHSPEPDPDVDLRVILGSDWQPCP